MESAEVFLSRLGRFVIVPIGLLLLALAAWSVWSTKTWIAHAVETQGTVIEMVRMRDSDNTGYLYAPLVRFSTAEGKTIEFQSSLHTNPPAYRTGQTVSVLYDPAVPESASIRGFFTLWFMALILSFIGMVFLGVGAAMVLLSGHAMRAFAKPATG
jgi:hypothetical protein